MIPATPGKRFGLAILLFFVFASLVDADRVQAQKADTTRMVELPVTVVTATRTAYALRDVPIPTRVLTSREINRSRAGRRALHLVGSRMYTDRPTLSPALRPISIAARCHAPVDHQRT